MNKVKICFVASILILILVIPAIFIDFIRGNVIGILCMCLVLIADTMFLKYIYPKFLFENRKSKRWCKILSDEELEIVEDAKELIKSVDKKIVISEFNIYKVRFVQQAWFRYDEDNQELNIFAPFKFLLKYCGRDACFLIVLHEVLHSQNLKNNIAIFNDEFLEGLNQLLTIWLIENYSEKYKMTNSVKICLCFVLLTGEIYSKEVNMVKQILQKSNIDIKQVFLNYIDIQPEFFEKFVPSEFFEKQ